MAASDSLTLKTIKGLSSKVMVKDIFLHNGGHCNAFEYVEYVVLEVGNILPIDN